MGQEPIMTEHIKIRALSGKWSIRAAGAVIAETRGALELTERGYDPVIYFPRDDIAMAFLDQTDKTSHCPHKGDASYFSIITKNGPIENVAWSYETPNKAVAKIKHHLAFYLNDKITIEQV